MSHYPEVFYLNNFSPSNYFSIKVIIFLDALLISFSFILYGTVPQNRCIVAFCSLNYTIFSGGRMVHGVGEFTEIPCQKAAKQIPRQFYGLNISLYFKSFYAKWQTIKNNGP